MKSFSRRSRSRSTSAVAPAVAPSTNEKIVRQHGKSISDVIAADVLAARWTAEALSAYA
jgi:hypothetical protein